MFSLQRYKKEAHAIPKTTNFCRIVKILSQGGTLNEKNPYICSSKGSEQLELEGFDEKGIG